MQAESVKAFCQAAAADKESQVGLMRTHFQISLRREDRSQRLISSDGGLAATVRLYSTRLSAHLIVARRPFSWPHIYSTTDSPPTHMLTVMFRCWTPPSCFFLLLVCHVTWPVQASLIGWGGYSCLWSVCYQSSGNNNMWRVTCLWLWLPKHGFHGHIFQWGQTGSNWSLFGSYFVRLQPHKN